MQHRQKPPGTPQIHYESDFELILGCCVYSLHIQLSSQHEAYRVMTHGFPHIQAPNPTWGIQGYDPGLRAHSTCHCGLCLCSDHCCLVLRVSSMASLDTQEDSSFCVVLTALPSEDRLFVATLLRGVEQHVGSPHMAAAPGVWTEVGVVSILQKSKARLHS